MHWPSCWQTFFEDSLRKWRVRHCWYALRCFICACSTSANTEQCSFCTVSPKFAHCSHHRDVFDKRPDVPHLTRIMLQQFVYDLTILTWTTKLIYTQAHKTICGSVGAHHLFVAQMMSEIRLYMWVWNVPFNLLFRQLLGGCPFETIAIFCIFTPVLKASVFF